MNLNLLGEHAVKTQVYFLRGWEKMLFLFWIILTAQNHLPEVVLYSRTDGTLPVWWETRNTSGAMNIVCFGKKLSKAMGDFDTCGVGNDFGGKLEFFFNHELGAARNFVLETVLALSGIWLRNET